MSKAADTTTTGTVPQPSTAAPVAKDAGIRTVHLRVTRHAPKTRRVGLKVLATNQPLGTPTRFVYDEEGPPFCPTLYDQMEFAIQQCQSVDEVLQCHDQARALEIYAEQSKNTAAEHKLREIRLRSERRCGELTAQLERQQGKRGDLTSSNDVTKSGEEKPTYTETLERVGLNRQTAHRYEEVAAIPKEKFEQALTAPTMPSTSGILRAAEAQASPPSEPVPGEVHRDPFHRDASSKSEPEKAVKAPRPEVHRQRIRNVSTWTGEICRELLTRKYSSEEAGEVMSAMRSDQVHNVHIGVRPLIEFLQRIEAELPRFVDTYQGKGPR